MLVLSRKKGEEILIGDDVVVTVHRLSGNRVSIGIKAPNSYRIIRGELCATDVSDNRPASSSRTNATDLASPGELKSDDAVSEEAKPSAAGVPPLGSGRTNRIAEHLSQTLRFPR